MRAPKHPARIPGEEFAAGTFLRRCASCMDRRCELRRGRRRTGRTPGARPRPHGRPTARDRGGRGRAQDRRASVAQIGGAGHVFGSRVRPETQSPPRCWRGMALVPRHSGDSGSARRARRRASSDSGFGFSSCALSSRFSRSSTITRRRSATRSAARPRRALPICSAETAFTVWGSLAPQRARNQ